MNHGITRIIITDIINGSGAWRFKEAAAKQPAANGLYRTIFERLDMPLLPGELQLRVAKDEFEAGYDHYLGIDVIFTFANEQESTLQEKFLTYRESTVTVEYYQNPLTGEQGDWFKMKPDYYFVGYDRIQKNNFQEWILLNWPLTRQVTNQGQIPWEVKSNTRDGARANFKYVPFSIVPPECVVHGKWSGREHIGVEKRDLKVLEKVQYERRAEQMMLFEKDIIPTVANYGDYRSRTAKRRVSYGRKS